VLFGKERTSRAPNASKTRLKKEQQRFDGAREVAMKKKRGVDEESPGLPDDEVDQYAQDEEEEDEEFYGDDEELGDEDDFDGDDDEEFEGDDEYEEEEYDEDEIDDFDGDDDE